MKLSKLTVKKKELNKSGITLDSPKKNTAKGNKSSPLKYKHDIAPFS